MAPSFPTVTVPVPAPLFFFETLQTTLYSWWCLFVFLSPTPSADIGAAWWLFTVGLRSISSSLCPYAQSAPVLSLILILHHGDGPCRLTRWYTGDDHCARVHTRGRHCRFPSSFHSLGSDSRHWIGRCVHRSRHGKPDSIPAMIVADDN